MSKKKKLFKYLYLVIVIFFFLSPFIINHKIFLNPKRTIGRLASTEKKNKTEKVMVVFTDNGIEYELVLNKSYLKNNQVELIYNSQNPNEVIPYSFLGIYFLDEMAVIIFLFVIISAFYFTLKNTNEIEIEDDFIN